MHEEKRKRYMSQFSHVNETYAAGHIRKPNDDQYSSFVLYLEIAC